jgi:hypothetical protein
MFSAQFLGFVALGLALIGLLAVVLEAAVKSPSTILDLVLDSRRVAFPEPRAESADRVTIGYLAPKAPANADQRVAA